MFTNILIVEDEMIIALDLELKLKNLRHNVTGTVSTGLDAIRFVNDNEVDLIFMDIFLKGKLSGVETALIIREKYDTPIIYNSANSDFITHEKVKKTENYGFLVKPFDDIKLQQVIDNIIKL